jgi:choline kinase
MQTIILAAGNNERFDGVHKSTLIAPDERTVLENQVERLSADPVAVIAQRKYSPALRVPISKLSLMGDTARTVMQVWLDRPTDGPIDTLHRAAEILEFFQQDKPVQLVYCDIIPSEECANQFPKMCEGTLTAGVVVFESDEGRFQDAPGGVQKLSGLFWFETVSLLSKMIRKLPSSQRGPENGIADLVLSTKNPGFFQCNDLVDIGTPESYERWVK